MQPDNPAELSGKIYEMMSSAIAGKWSSQSQAQPSSPFPEHNAPINSPFPEYNAPAAEPVAVEAEVVEPEPVESGKQK